MDLHWEVFSFINVEGGLELAMSGHYRLALPSIKVGLVELKIGLLPGK
jgi:enoyl-CoA hydratase/carnithine racemase